MQLDELTLADAQLDLPAQLGTQLDSPLGASLQLGPLGQVHSSSTQLDSLENLDAQLDPLVQPGSLGSLALLNSTTQSSIVLPDLMPKHALLMQHDMLPFAHTLGLLLTQPLAHALGSTTQLGSLCSLALLGLTAVCAGSAYTAVLNTRRDIAA